MNISSSIKLAVTSFQLRDLQGLAAALRPATSGEVAETMNALLTPVFSLFVKSRNYQWHICGSQFRNSHRLLEEHGDQVYSMLQLPCASSN